MALDPNLPYQITFSYPGILSPVTGVATWRCPFAAATIISVACSLGRGSSPAGQSVIVDVLRATTAITPSYTSIYSGATPNAKPEILVGYQVGLPAVPNITSLSAGDTLTVDILQSGGGATPTDHDLSVTVYMLVAI